MNNFNKDGLIILYEDNHLLVVLKPQGVPACEDSSKDKDMLTVLKEYLKEKYSKTGNVFVGLVHRLDRPTGGVMVFAKTSKCASRLSESLKDGEFEKTYLAILSGVPKNTSGRLTHYLKKNALTNTVYTVGMAADDAKKAELDYEIKEQKGNYCLAEIKLLTGRSHQIRVQFAAIGAPVLADAKYSETDGAGGNLALWAYKLVFPHPITKERMVFIAEPPDANPWKAFNIKNIVKI